MVKRKYEVIAEDQNGDVWIVASERQDAAIAIMEKFKKEGYTNVRIVENF